MKVIEPANLVDEITIDAQPVLSTINAGISDFSSAVELDAKAEEIAVEILPEDSVDTQSETKASKTRQKSQPKARKKSVARKSKSERENKTNPTASEKQQDSLREKQHITDKVAETSSSIKKKKEQPPKQEEKSRASIGLPQWKPPSR